jgi:hypothetical protein
MTEPTPFSRPFEAPPSDERAQEAATRAAAEPLATRQRPPESLAEDLLDVPAALRDTKAELQELLRSRGEERLAAAAQASPEPTDRSPAIEGPGGVVVGFGLGRAGIGAGRSEGPLAAPGSSVLTVYVAEPTPPDGVRRLLVSSLGARVAARVPLEVVHTGVFRTSSSHTVLRRPAAGGGSAHHVRPPGAYGTLGCLARGRTAPRDGRLLVLSNNHVLTSHQTAALHDCVVQPSPGDGGSCPAHQIAILERFAPVVPGGVPNYVDCATAWAWPDRVRKEILYVSEGVDQFHRIGASPPDIGNPAEIDRGTWVAKSGRTTGLTYGVVDDFAVSAWIGGTWGGVPSWAWFNDLIRVRTPSGTFASSGDSGSVVFTADVRSAPVGLVAGASVTNMTLVCRMDSVLSALDIVLEV